MRWACLQLAPAGNRGRYLSAMLAALDPTTVAVQGQQQGWASGQVASQASMCHEASPVLAHLEVWRQAAPLVAVGVLTLRPVLLHNHRQQRCRHGAPSCCRCGACREGEGRGGGPFRLDAGLQTQHNRLLPQAAMLHQSSRGYQASRTWPGGTSSGEWRRQGSAAAPDALKPA